MDTTTSDAELVAVYLGIIRHELRVRRGEDALDALETRLSPADVASRPPAKAPGIARLRSGARRLRKHRSPDASLEQFSEDLRFLRLFDDDEHPLDSDALQRLMHDVTGASPSASAAKKTELRIVPLPPRSRKKP